MGKILVIAEKPSVGRDIAKVLGCKSKGNGFLFSDEYIISWAIGHLVALCEPEDYDKGYKKWSMDSLPILPKTIKLKPISNTESQLKVLKSLMNDKEVDELICATDAGREGELIFRYIYSIVKCKKPFKRLWISSMTDAAIKEGFNNLKDGKEFDSLYYSAKCRSEADWLVGINATRAYTIKYKTIFSVGRVQTPTLAIIVARQKEINSFVAKEYWEIKGFYDGFSGTWFNSETKETKIFDLNAAEEIKTKVFQKSGIVESVENEEKSKPAPLLYDLTELQRECNRKFGLSAKDTLAIVQGLYEKRKMVTYPRTDSRYLSDDLAPKLPKIISRLNFGDYQPFVTYIQGLEKLPITKRIVDNSKVSDHHAIIPTDISVNISSLSAEELKVYDLIVRRFLSVFYPSYIYNVTKITTLVEGERFLSKGTTIIRLGYMELYDKSELSGDEDASELLPDLKEGDSVFQQDTQLIKKKTQPPKPYTEATLLSAMENAGKLVEDEELKEALKDSGLGTPATRAQIIERLISVGYVERKGKTLIPTEKAMKIIERVPQELKSAETTGKWEKGLKQISKGKMETSRFMGSIVRYVNFIIEESKKAEL